MSKAELPELSSDQKILLIGIGACVWFATLFLLIGILIVAHEAIRVEAGKGDSWIAAFAIMFIFPLGVAFGLCSGLRLWFEFQRVRVRTVMLNSPRATP